MFLSSLARLQSSHLITAMAGVTKLVEAVLILYPYREFMVNASNWGEHSKAFETGVHHLRPPFLAATIKYLTPSFVVLLCTPIGIIRQKFLSNRKQHNGVAIVAHCACALCCLRNAGP